MEAGDAYNAIVDMNESLTKPTRTFDETGGSFSLIA